MFAFFSSPFLWSTLHLGGRRAERIMLASKPSIALGRQNSRVPGGSIGRQFTSMLAKEYELFSIGVHKSERPSMFGKIILQKDKHIKKSSDIRRVLKRRMQLWDDDKLELIV